MMIWNEGWRNRAWENINQEWDLIIIGGGITGAGVLRQAVDAGFKALLVEAHDFGSGTSSRSSKLVHGGKNEESIKSSKNQPQSLADFGHT